MSEVIQDNNEPESAKVIDLEKQYDVIIVGAGAAGVGVAIALTHVGVNNYLIVDRDSVGSSFADWPEETRFITPSFPSNSIGMLDLNSIAIGVSPAYTMRVEHPTGNDFAEHLRSLSDYFELPVLENTNITGIEKKGDIFSVKTESIDLKCKNVIWAAGEYKYPSTGNFQGSEHCAHTSTVDRYGDLEGDDFLIIGGYESGIDAAYHLARSSKKVKVFDIECPWGDHSSDPSIALSTYSFERMRDENFGKNVELFAETGIRSVSYTNETYEVVTLDDEIHTTKTKPLLATGFEGSHRSYPSLFDLRKDGFPLVNDNDESTVMPGVFLCGPSLRHDNHIFCFIFKYRQRFGVVAKTIAESLGLETEGFVETYRSWGMYLDDLSCCGQECLTC
tara:strand:- start:1203 stop:2375 length:1173 start_codon:yes stop_codon:yes gene_type:complete